MLGQGTFGQVVKCQDMKTHDVVAVKVVKNKPAYFNQSMMEVTILEMVRPVCSCLRTKSNLSYTSPLPHPPTHPRPAQHPMRPARRTPHPPPKRLLHPPKPSLSRLRAALVEPVRAHQAEPVPRPEHAARQGVHGAVVGRDVGIEGCEVDTL